MLRNYLKVFFRNTIKNPGYSLINILGLAIGLACSIVAFLYILNETSYNKGFKDYDKIYRIGAGVKNKMLNDSSSTTLFDIAPSLVEQIPEVIASARFVTWYSSTLIKTNNEYFPDINVLVSDSAMLDVFSFKILQGDPNSFLKSPHQIAITKSLAKKIFRDKDPMQQMIKFEGEDLEVAWIMEDPVKSMINFEIVANFEFMEELKGWLAFDVYTFFKTEDYLSPQTESKIRKVSDKILLEAMSDWADTVNSPIQPLKDLYLKSNLHWEMGRIGSLRTLYIFGFLAGIILLIAVINYVNLLTSRSEYRNKEVGIRKVVGADKGKLRYQFLGESIVLTIISLLIAFVIAEFVIYLVNEKLNLNLSLFEQSNLWIFFVYFLVSIFVGVFSGIYPAFVMSNYSSLKVIKGIFDAGGRSNFLKILLVIIQFSISTFLIIAIFIFNSQIKYLKNKDLGFDEKNLVILSECSKLNKSYQSIRQELLSYHHIKNVSASQSIPGWGRSGQTIRKKTDDPNKVISTAENRVLDFYTETMGIEVIMGRSFDPDYDDDRSILINETAAKLLGVEDPIGLEVVTNNRELIIIGVVKDYHFYKTTQKLGALYLSNYREWFNNIEIRIDPEDKFHTIQYIKNVIMKYEPDYYWNYFFIDDMFANKYKVEERLFTMIMWGSGIALILSILGLFALTSYTVSKKFKEIGIRKTFGASISNIINKLNKDIIRWVLLTNVVAWPVAYFVMKNWLQNYPYKVDINFVYFLLASLISLFIAWITISVQAVKAASMNPVDAIRYE